MTSTLPPKEPPRFYRLTMAERQKLLCERSGLTPADMDALGGSAGLSSEQAGYMIENAVGVFGLPLGIAQNFMINGREVLIPMVIEESSVIAGASFMAKLARPAGGFFAHATAPVMIGQMQVLQLEDPYTARLLLLEQKQRILALAAEADPLLVSLGGGPRDLEVRVIEESPIGAFLVAHLLIDVRDAMGANAVNTAVECVAPLIEEISGGVVHLKILSNLADRRLCRARCTIRLDQLAFEGYSADQVRDGIIAAWAFAHADPYRAATHNKGIMNGVDAVVIASGNDWRAIEAGAHAYAATNGAYSSLSTWGKDAEGNLVGTLEMPMAVGIIGGATKVHPAAQAAIKLMEVQTAAELAEVIVSVGLAQNLAALRALATEGIQRGHMGLHARQVAIAAGARGEDIECVARQLVREKRVRSDRAQEILSNLQNPSNNPGDICNESAT